MLDLLINSTFAWKTWSEVQVLVQLITFYSTPEYCIVPYWEMHEAMTEFTDYNQYHSYINGKKCINKQERVRHLPGYCP